MHQEIATAAAYLKALLERENDQAKVEQFLTRLKAALQSRFVSHWHEDRPIVGNAYRCLSSSAKIDPVLLKVVPRHR